MADPKKIGFLVKRALARSLPPPKSAKRLFFADQNTEPRKLCDVNYWYSHGRRKIVPIIKGVVGVKLIPCKHGTMVAEKSCQLQGCQLSRFHCKLPLGVNWVRAPIQNTPVNVLRNRDYTKDLAIHSCSSIRKPVVQWSSVLRRTLLCVMLLGN